MSRRIITRAEVEVLQKRCQRGTTSYDAANSLHADCYGALGALAAERDALCAALTKAINEADRWSDESWGAPASNLDHERQLLKEPR